MGNLIKNYEKRYFDEINVTNLVDIALTMVVVLMLISPFIEQGFNVKLPSSSPAKLDVSQSTIITVAPGSVYYIGNRKTSPEELPGLLKAERDANPDISVVIKGEWDVPYQDVVSVLDMVKKCGIAKVGLATLLEKKCR